MIVLDKNGNIIKVTKIIGCKDGFALVEVESINENELGWKKKHYKGNDFKLEELEDDKYYWFVPIKNIENKMMIMDIQ